MAVKTWVWIVVGLVALALLAIVALVGAGVYYVARHVDSTTTSAASAADALDAERARFAGGPLLTIDEHGQTIESRLDAARPPAAVAPTAMVVLAWDADEQRLVRIRLPFWLLRLASHGRASIEFGRRGPRVPLERLHLSVADLERLGPVLLVDYQSPTGDRVLVWTE